MAARRQPTGDPVSTRSTGMQEPGAAGVEFLMPSKQHILRFIDASGEVRRPPLVGMQFLHQPTMGTPDFLGTRSRLKAKDLIGLLFRHFSGPPPVAPPRCRTALNVITPAGLPAVKIRGQ